MSHCFYNLHMWEISILIAKRNDRNPMEMGGLWNTDTFCDLNNFGASKRLISVRFLVLAPDILATAFASNESDETTRVTIRRLGGTWSDPRRPPFREKSLFNICSLLCTHKWSQWSQALCEATFSNINFKSWSVSIIFYSKRINCQWPIIMKCNIILWE